MGSPVDRREPSTAGWRRLVVLLVALTGLACGDPRPVSETGPVPEPVSVQDLSTLPGTQWVRLVTSLSEPGGYFDTDNLISNETSYLHVLGAMRRLGVRGGAYMGVGPDQNFSYIAAQRPALAFVVDIRRDNLLHHLLLKALFHEADTRMEYLALLFGRDVPRGPAGPEGWAGEGVATLLEALGEEVGDRDRPAAAAARERVLARVRTFGLPLSEEDLATVVRFHDAFIRLGPALRFTSYGRPPRPGYPTYGQLLVETDLEGLAGSYLAAREDFLFLKRLQEANRVIPVVGDLAGPSALRAVGDEVRRRGLAVRGFYVSNVEYYLVRGRTFDRFAANVASLPVDRWSVLIRSVFPSASRHPDAVPGHLSTQTLVRLEDVQEVVAGDGYAGYGDLVTRDRIPLRDVGGGLNPGGPPDVGKDEETIQPSGRSR